MYYKVLFLSVFSDLSPTNKINKIHWHRALQNKSAQQLFFGNPAKGWDGLTDLYRETHDGSYKAKLKNSFHAAGVGSGPGAETRIRSGDPVRSAAWSVVDGVRREMRTPTVTWLVLLAGDRFSKFTGC